MNWTDAVLELIDIRSFSSLWYWIVVAAVWSMAIHDVLGIPYDMVGRAARQGGRAQSELETLAHIRADRLVAVAQTVGPWLVAFLAAVLTALLVLAVVYGIELAQAVVLLVGPMTVVWAMSFRRAADISAVRLDGADLRRTLVRHRIAVQLLGILSIFVTALWGMYHNLTVGPLG